MDLAVEGRHALLFDDDATSGFVNSREALVPWIADPSLLIDRFDARHLLDRPPTRPAARNRPDPDHDHDHDLDRERYLDLPPYSPPPDAAPVPPSETKKRVETAKHGAYQAVPFSYCDTDVSVDSHPDMISSYSGFHPPFPVPDNLLNNVPPTEKLHQIISRTAIFVSEHGGQSEIILRVKQGDNPTFGFLMPDHHLHPYFRFLVDHPRLLKSDMNSTRPQQEKNLDGQEKEACVAGGALSLLGSIYGSGEDDDGMLETDHNKLETHNVDIGVRAEKKESTHPMALDEKTITKHPVTAPAKVKNPASRRHHLMNSASASAACSKKVGDDMLPSSQPGMSGNKSFILEPPSFLKRMMDKIIELIIRNGKDFEAVLMEQDKTIGRFPFLLPSNQYHSYYLKVLEEAREGHLKDRWKVQEAPNKESASCDQISAEQLEGWSFGHQRKEKFKMVIGGPKKDSHDQHSKPSRQSGVSADEAAAIVLAATRGVSPANARSLGETRLASSTASLSSLQGSSRIPKPASNGEATDSESIEKQVQAGSGKIDDVLVAKVVAKTAALAASSEADSSEAGLTKEQKLKAERLKRAKMFAAMIKGGGQHVSEFVQTASVHSRSLEASTGGSGIPLSEPDVMAKEREGSSVPIDVEISDRMKLCERSFVHNHHMERKYRERHHSRSRDHEQESEDDRKQSRKQRHSEYSSHYKEEPEEDHKHSKERHHSGHSSCYEEEPDEGHKHSRKKHHSKHSSCYGVDDHKRRKSHSSKDKESRHHHKHYSSSEDAHRHRKRSRSRHRHKSHHHSDNEDQEKKRHRKKLAERKNEVAVADNTIILNHSNEVSLSSINSHQEVGAPAVPDAQPSDATIVPDELRAKVRAMLLETM